MNPDWRSRYNLAVEVTKKAGDHARQIYEATFHNRDNLEVIQKADESPVTIADRGAEKLIRELVRKHFPQDGFLGEEFGDQPGESGFRWIIDPIDGTKSFIRHIPLWGTLLALEYRGEQIAGVIYVPVIRHLYRALRGDGAFFDDYRIRVSRVAQLSEATLGYSSLQQFSQAKDLAAFQKLYNATARQRGFGDFYGFCLVAQGSMDIMIDYGVHSWDVAPVKVLVEEAGGQFTDWSGKPTIDTPDCLATNGQLHAATLQMLK